MLESIIFAVLSRSKVWISFFIWAFRLNRNKFVRAFYVFATSSRRLSSDDITSIFTSCYSLIRIRKRDYTSVYKAPRVWLFVNCSSLINVRILTISSTNWYSTCYKIMKTNIKFFNSNKVFFATIFIFRICHQMI
jgi:hypothetical protein